MMTSSKKLGQWLGTVVLTLAASTAFGQDVPAPEVPDPTIAPPPPAASPAPAVPAAAAPEAEPPEPVGPLPSAKPVVWDIRQRSGLITRYTPVRAQLPPDPGRDTFYRTRWDDWYHPYPRGRNCYKDGGMYGQPLPADCTAAVAPSFRGAPGVSTIRPECQPPTKYGRMLGNLVHPFRPVGMYYDRGVYAPIYDLDPLVPGPGPFPWNHYIKRHLGG
jgi:hypothetical protein